MDLAPPLLLKILTTTIAPINLKRVTLTICKKSVINHEFRIPRNNSGLLRHLLVANYSTDRLHVPRPNSRKTTSEAILMSPLPC